MIEWSGLGGELLKQTGLVTMVEHCHRMGHDKCS